MPGTSTLASIIDMAKVMEAQGLAGPYRVELGDDVRSALVAEGAIPSEWLSHGRPLVVFRKGDDFVVSRGGRHG